MNLWIFENEKFLQNVYRKHTILLTIDNVSYLRDYFIPLYHKCPLVLHVRISIFDCKFEQIEGLEGERPDLVRLELILNRINFIQCLIYICRL